MNINEYSYKELIKTVESERTEENINTLGEWFEQYGRQFWNGEYYDVVELDSRLFPIYDFEYDEDGEIVQGTITGYELR